MIKERTLDLSPEVIDEPTKGKERGVTGRVALLSLVLATIFGYVIPIVDFKMSNTFLGASHLPVGALGTLLILCLVVNPLITKVKRGWAFSRNEQLTVYITCLFSALVPGRGGETFWIPNVMGSFYYATRENNWLSVISPYVKPWMTPALNADGTYNESLVRAWYEGGAISWGAWIVPLILWSSLILALYAMLACLGVMLRAQWSENEALSFPLLRLPLEMTRNDGDAPFAKNGLMWLGFGAAAFIQMLNGVSFYFPDVPAVPLQISTGKLFTEAPWNQIGAFTFLAWPIVIGISYILTTEISFSIWFFYLFTRAQLVVAYFLGYTPAMLPEAVFTRGYSKNFVFFQQIGAFIMFAIAIFWIGRYHYGHIFKRAIGRAKANTEEASEPLSYPVAFWGFVLSSLFLLGWTYAAGVRLDLAIVIWLAYIIVAVCLARVVAEGGLLVAQSGWAPLGPLINLLGGGKWLSASSIVPAAYIGGAVMSEMRGFLLPSFVQSFKLAHDRKIPMRPLLGLITACIVITLAVSQWQIIRLGFNEGGLNLHKWWANANGALGPIQTINEGLKTDGSMNWINWSWLSIGAAETWGMMWLRSRFAWFPLHPIGLLMCAPQQMYFLWFSVFLGWLVKITVIRYGGVQQYRHLMPFALGIIMGEIFMMLFWLCVDGWFGRVGHQLMPG
jgi:hypothetical protein